MKDPVFLWSVLILIGGAFVGYLLWSRDRVPQKSKRGWRIEMVGFGIAYLGAAVGLGTGKIEMGAMAILVGFCIGLAGLFLFTRAPKE